MATQDKILEELAKATGPMAAPELGEKLGERVNKFNIQLTRLIKDGEIEKTDAGYIITQGGRDRLYKPSEVAAGLTDYDYFRNLGKSVGIPPDALNVTVDHVWEGGDYRDLNWVWKALVEMQIRKDLRARWFHKWRSYLGQGVPPEIATEVASVKAEKDEVTKAAAAKGKRDYIITPDNLPIYVGEFCGDLDEDRAFELAKIRAARGTGQPQGQPMTPGTMAEEVGKILTAVREFAGPEAKGKSWVVSEGEEGFDVKELEEGRPVVLPSRPKGSDAQPHHYFVNDEGEVKEIAPGTPIVIKKEVVPPSSGKQFLVDKGTGEVTEVTGGVPIVIIRENAPASSPSPMLQAKDAEGNPLVIDLSSYFRLEEHKAKIERDKETHEAKMDVFKEFKGLISKAAKAAGHMAEEE